MRALSTPTIASTKIAARTAGGETFDIVVEIGTPYPEDRCWACPVALFGLYDDLMAQRGEDSLQALCLGIWFVGEMLRGFQEDGGSLAYPEGSEFPLKAYKLGLDPVVPRPDDRQAEP